MTDQDEEFARWKREQKKNTTICAIVGCVLAVALWVAWFMHTR